MGRPWPQPGEPLFLDDDIDEVLDFLAWEESLCPGCGRPKSETFHPDSEGAYEVRKLRCHACAEKDRAADSHSHGGADSAGLFYVVERDDGDDGG